MAHPEFELQTAICDYLDIKYPNTPFFSTGIPFNLRPPQALRMKRIQKPGFKVPDVFVAAPGYQNGQFPGKRNGLFLEVKIKSPFKKDGNIRSGYVSEQYEALIRLRHLNYEAQFIWTLEMAKVLIDGYLR